MYYLKKKKKKKLNVKQIWGSVRIMLTWLNSAFFLTDRNDKIKLKSIMFTSSVIIVIYH